MGMREAPRGGRGRREGPGAETMWAAGSTPLRFLAVFALALLAAGILGLIAYQMVYGQRVILGAKVHDMDVGGLSREDASRLIRSKLAEYERSPITLRFSGQDWKLSPGQMGVQLDGEKTVDSALRAGKRDNPIGNLLAQLGALGTGVHVDVIYSVDPEKFGAFVKRLSVQIDQVSVNAAIRIEGGRVILTTPKEGFALEQAKLRERVEQRIGELSSAAIEVPVTRTPPKVTEQDLAPARARAQQLISAPVRFTLDGKVLDKWTLSESKLATMVVFEEAESGGKRQLTATLNKEVGRDLAGKIAVEVNQRPLNARFDWNGGRLKSIANSRDGRALDVDRFVSDLESAATASGERKVALPLKVEKPLIGSDDGARMGIKGQIEERKTDYSGGAAERRFNVELGAKRIHGVVVPPGETLSFAGEVGDVTEENGYKLGFAIIGADTVPDPGGGICQVSTTVFQALFWAGYEIVERHPHAYRIRRYEQPYVGLDAAIYPPDLDLRLKNNSDSYLLIQTRTDGRWLYVTLYGTKPSWTVKVDAPQIANVVPADRSKIIKQYTPKMDKGREVWVETAEDGLDVTVYRTVTRGSDVISKDRVFTRFRPERNVVLVGTGGAPAPPEEILPVPTSTPTPGPIQETPTPAASATPAAATSATPARATSATPAPTQAAPTPTATPARR